MKAKIIIDRELCKSCGYCIMACAKKIISFDENFNAMGYHPAMPVNIDKCNGCELCAIVCPDIAIEVYKNDK